MNYRFVLDSYAWVEYAIGSQMGKFVDFLLKYTACITPSIVIAELSDKFHREDKVSDWQILFKFIKHKSIINTLTENLEEKSGGCKLILRGMQKSEEKKIGLADAIIYQTALDNDCELVTGDKHFEAINGIVYLKKKEMLVKIKEKILKNLKE